ncbi:hypothetical protein [Micromonospora sp. L32]|uniref:hypothetical protein n=1 Tax=Micromonospora TaxID=1873 RepID=UPI003F89D639
MPASLKRIRETMKVAPTARNKGLKLTITVVAYDSGMVEVDTVPMDGADASADWLDAAAVVAATMAEFRRQAAKRQASLDV